MCPHPTEIRRDWDLLLAMVTTPASLSIVIPIARRETHWKALIEDLKPFWAKVEIIFAHAAPATFPNSVLPKGFSCPQVTSKAGRAHQLNAGARVASRPYLWFLHADSRLDHPTVAKLLAALDRRPDDLHFFDLEFLDDGPALVHLNAIGCWLRSHILGAPFGDQGFCLKRQVFTRLGGFVEQDQPGEDHLLVWRARERGVRLHPVGCFIRTSARKYLAEGWYRTTLNHQRLWLKQTIDAQIKLWLKKPLY